MLYRASLERALQNFIKEFYTLAKYTFGVPQPNSTNELIQSNSDGLNWLCWLLKRHLWNAILFYFTTFACKSLQEALNKEHPE